MKMTVKEVATLTGVSVRTLHYYHREGILIPSEVTENKYRYYDAANLAQLQNILFLRELDFSIQEIKGILADPDYDERDAFKKQRHLLLLKRRRLDKLIALLDQKLEGEKTMNFKPFDMTEIEANKKQYETEVKERWGKTDAYRQSQLKTTATARNNGKRSTLKPKRSMPALLPIWKKMPLTRRFRSWLPSGKTILPDTITTVLKKSWLDWD